MIRTMLPNDVNSTFSVNCSSTIFGHLIPGRNFQEFLKLLRFFFKSADYFVQKMASNHTNYHPQMHSNLCRWTILEGKKEEEG